MRHFVLTLLLLTFLQYQSEAKTYYVSKTGNNSNNGSISSPFLTIEKALQSISGGDLIYLREGVYYPRKTFRTSFASGTQSQRTRFFAYPGETAIIDGSRFSEFDPDENDNDMFRHSAAFWHFKDIEIRKAPSTAIEIYSSNAQGNIVENVKTYDNGNTGIAIYSGASNTLIKNCDSYRNFDPQNNGQDADGFAAKFEVGTGNKFVGCRAWDNSDDGWDVWRSLNTVLLEQCWAYRNGYDIWNFGSAFEGNGDGFKFGQGKGPHLVINCAAWNNDLRGFNSNNNESTLEIYNCTAWDNDFLNFDLSKGTGDFVIKNCLSHNGNINVPSYRNQEHNSWNLNVDVNDNDFISLSSDIAEGARSSGYDLPSSGFLRLKEGSDLIDKGVVLNDVSHFGPAPDLGAFESNYVVYLGSGKSEFEDMALDNYKVVSWGNTDLIQMERQNSSGSAEFTFNGEPGRYDFSIRYRDENDGASTLKLVVNGTTRGEWIADDVTSSSSDQWKTFSIDNIQVNANSEVRVEADANAGEYARLDYLEMTPSVQLTNIVIKAKGDTGDEKMELLINDQTVRTWDVTTSFQNFSYQGEVSGNIKVAFTNDLYQTSPVFIDRNMIIDYISVDDRIYQAEDMSTNTGVWQNNSCGGSNSDIMHCGGYIDFGNHNSNSSNRLFSNRTLSNVNIYPNPSQSSSLHIDFPYAQENTTVSIVTLEGKILNEAIINGISSHSFNVKDYGPGIYLIMIRSANESVYSRKFIKK